MNESEGVQQPLCLRNGLNTVFLAAPANIAEGGALIAEWKEVFAPLCKDAFGVAYSSMRRKSSSRSAYLEGQEVLFTLNMRIASHVALHFLE